MSRLASVVGEDGELLDACLAFCLDRGDVFPDWEWDSLFGESRGELAVLARDWRLLDADRATARRLLAYLGAVSGYPGALEAFGPQHEAQLRGLEDRLMPFRGGPFD